MQRIRRMVIVAVLALSAGACGGDNDGGGTLLDPLGDDAGSAGESDSDGGGGSTESGSSGSRLDSDPSAPAGETEGGIPYPAGGLDVLDAAGINIGGQRQLHYPVDRYDELVAFFDDYVESLSGETSRSDILGAINWQIFPEGGGTSLISVEPEFETTLDGEDITVTFVFLVDGG